MTMGKFLTNGEWLILRLIEGFDEAGCWSCWERGSLDCLWARCKASMDRIMIGCFCILIIVFARRYPMDDDFRSFKRLLASSFARRVSRSTIATDDSGG